MNTTQKIIKYLAIAFAVFLIVTIISAILTGLYALSNVLGLRNDNETIGEMKTIEIEESQITTLDIDVAFTNLIIKIDDSFKIETNNNNINYNQDNQNIQITEKAHKWFERNYNGDLILYIPETIEFEKVKINAGAGKINIENLNTEELELELGAGETEIKTLNVTRDCNIDGGAGKFSILSGNINNLDLDIGMGETNLTAKLKEKSDIDAGVGNVNITLLGNKEDYKIDIDKGLGNINIDEDSFDVDGTYGTGENFIKVDGGVGNIKVDFE